MGYVNRPNTSKSNNNSHGSKYNKNYNGFKNTGGQPSKLNNEKNVKKNNFFSKDKEDIYTPKTYPKKQKNKSFFDEEILPEYIADKQRIRDKRRNDKKYKNKNKRGY